MTLSPVWTKRCTQCWRRKQLQQGAKPKSRTEPGSTHIPHRAQRQHQEPQTQQLLLPTARRQRWSPAHRASSLGPRSPARLTQAITHGTSSPKPHGPALGQIPAPAPRACTRQSPKAAAIKPWAHPGRANTRHNQALAQDGPWGTQ